MFLRIMPFIDHQLGHYYELHKSNALASIFLGLWKTTLGCDLKILAETGLFW